MKVKLLFSIAVLSLATHQAIADTRTYFNKADHYAIPSAKNSNGYFGWSQCWDNNDDSQPIGPSDVSGLPTICRPDTLYSWGNAHKLNMLKQEAGANAPWAKLFSVNVFAHINPLATFGYGIIAFRIKLRRGIHYFLSTDNSVPTSHNGECKQLSEEQQRNTLVVRAWENGNTDGVDYIICSPEIIESWSYDTKTHYDEILASLDWNNEQLSQNPNAWIPYVYVNHQSTLFNSGLDSLDWSADVFWARMEQMQKHAEAGEGVIYYAPGVEHNRTAHFATNRPVYWNWNHPKPTAAAAKPTVPSPVVDKK